MRAHPGGTAFSPTAPSPTTVPRVADDERTGPYYVILDVAIRDVERYLTYMDR